MPDRESSTSNHLEAPTTQKDSLTGFVTPLSGVSPSTSATMVIGQLTWQDKPHGKNLPTNQGWKWKAPTQRPRGFPSAKRNRDYLAPEIKPIYFELKKHYKKQSQWKTHKMFLTNRYTSWYAPRSLTWNPLPPWHLPNPSFNTKWVETATRVQIELCNILAIDCAGRIRQQEATM